MPSCDGNTQRNSLIIDTTLYSLYNLSLCVSVCLSVCLLHRATSRPWWWRYVTLRCGVRQHQQPLAEASADCHTPYAARPPPRSMSSAFTHYKMISPHKAVIKADFLLFHQYSLSASSGCKLGLCRLAVVDDVDDYATPEQCVFRCLDKLCWAHAVLTRRTQWQYHARHIIPSSPVDTYAS